MQIKVYKKSVSFKQLRSANKTKNTLATPNYKQTLSVLKGLKKRLEKEMNEFLIVISC